MANRQPGPEFLSHRYKPGHAPTSPGRPRRVDKALAVFDAVLDVTSDEDNLKEMRLKLQAMMKKSPAAFLVKIWLPCFEAMTKANRHEIALIIQDRMQGASVGLAQEQLDILRTNPEVMQQAMALAKAMREAGERAAGKALAAAEAKAPIDIQAEPRPATDVTLGDNGNNGNGTGTTP